MLFNLSSLLFKCGYDTDTRLDEYCRHLEADDTLLACIEVIFTSLNTTKYKF